MSVGLNTPSPEPSAAVAPDKPVFVILRRIVSRWNTTAKVVAVHDNEEAAREDIALYRRHEPYHVFAIFVPQGTS